MKKVPSIKFLERQVLLEKGFLASLQVLFQNMAIFTGYQSVEEMALDENLDPKIWRLFEHHFRVVSTAIYRVFHLQGIFLSTQALHDILFFSLKTYPLTTIVSEVLKRIRSLGLERHSVVIFPLHSFGILGLGWHRALRKVRAPYFVAPDSDFILCPQSNSMEATNDTIKLALEHLNIKFRGEFPTHSLTHYRQTRPTKWLENNPLLICKLRFSRIVPYENQGIIAHNIERFVTLAYFISVIQKRDFLPSRKEWGLGSTSQVNNWETMDLHHYLTIAHEPGKRSIELNCTPLNVSQIALSELMALNVEFFPRMKLKEMRRIQNANKQLRKIFTTSEQSVWKRPKDITSRERFDLKCVDALTFFRRSFRATSLDEKIVNLATAFEALLLDSYDARKGGIDEVFRKRVRGVFRITKTKHCNKASQTVKILYAHRCEVVHSGKRVKDFEHFDLAQYAFIKVFELLHSPSSKLNFSKPQPIRDFFQRKLIDT